MGSASDSESRLVHALRHPWLTSLYDPVVRWTTRERAFQQALVEQADPREGHRLLDVGCGTGTLAVRVQDRWPGVEVVGLDGDREVLRVARAKAQAAGAPAVFDQGLSTALPYEDASFEAAFSTLLLHHLTRGDKERTLQEIARVFRPGGRLHVADWDRPANPLMRLAFLPVRALDGFDRTRANVRGRLPELMEAAGLVEVQRTRRMSTVLGTLGLFEAAAPERETT